MQLQDYNTFSMFSNDKEINLPGEATEDEEMENTDPTLDEDDLEENNLTVENADQVIWDPATKGSSGKEEKDITD